MAKPRRLASRWVQISSGRGWQPLQCLSLIHASFSVPRKARLLVSVARSFASSGGLTGSGALAGVAFFAASAGFAAIAGLAAGVAAAGGAGEAGLAASSAKRP